MIKDQEVFTKVKNHLLLQNAKSLSSTLTCAYRGAGGLKCAIGVLIDDKYYNGVIEKRGVTTYEVMNVLANSGIDPTNTTWGAA